MVIHEHCLKHRHKSVLLGGSHCFITEGLGLKGTFIEFQCPAMDRAANTRSECPGSHSVSKYCSSYKDTCLLTLAYTATAYKKILLK